MRHALAVFLQGDTIDHLKQLARHLSKKRQCDVSASEAIEFVVANHWKAQIKKRFIKKGNTAVAHPEEKSAHRTTV